MNTLQSANGYARAAVCTAENNTCPPSNMGLWLFDCRGHRIQEMKGSDYGPEVVYSEWVYTPPRSVGAQIAAIACGAPSAQAH